MIIINYNTADDSAKLAANAVERAGVDVDVTVNFSAAPNTPTGFRLGIKTSDNAPQLLAYTGTFTRQNDSEYTATLDANDTRLVTYLLRGQASLSIEFSVIIGGERKSPADLPITFQASALSGSPATEGGPRFYTAAEVDAAIGAALANQPRILTAVVGITGGGATKLDGIPTLGRGYNIVQFVDTTTNTGFRTFQRIASTAASDPPGFVRVADFDAVTNAYGWISR